MARETIAADSRRPPASASREPRQVRKEATAAVQPGAGVRRRESLFSARFGYCACGVRAGSCSRPLGRSARSVAHPAMLATPTRAENFSSWLHYCACGMRAGSCSRPLGRSARYAAHPAMLATPTRAENFSGWLRCCACSLRVGSCSRAPGRSARFAAHPQCSLRQSRPKRASAEWRYSTRTKTIPPAWYSITSGRATSFFRSSRRSTRVKASSPVTGARCGVAASR